MDQFVLPTAAISDAVVRLGLELRLGPPGLRPVIPGSAIAGRALPTRHAGSVDVFLEAIERAGKDAAGRVLLADNGGRTDEACIGDLVTLEAARAGLAGIVIWGFNRDSAEIRRIGLPVFSLGQLSAGPRRDDRRPEDSLGSADLGDHAVTADDVIYADDDGVVVVPVSELTEIERIARQIFETERAQADQARSGPTLRQQFGFDDYLAARDADPSLTFRQHLRRRQASIEE
jgi:regulator of RNase E activity RraA